MLLSEKIESCIRELKNGDRFLELENLIMELQAENDRLRNERERFRREASIQRQESEGLLNMFLEQIQQREKMIFNEQSANGAGNGFGSKPEAAYKGSAGVNEILGEANDDTAQRIFEQQKSLEEIKAEKQKAEEELFQLQKQRDEAKQEYENTRRLMEELMAGMKSIEGSEF